jgi:hypothetical protein
LFIPPKLHIEQGRAAKVNTKTKGFLQERNINERGTPKKESRQYSN